MFSGALALKLLFSVGIVLLMSWLASSNLFFLVGMVSLFPTFSMIGHFTTWSAGGATAVKDMTLFSIFATIPYVIYLLSVYFLVGRFSIITTLATALAIWAGFALIIIKIWSLRLS